MIITSHFAMKLRYNVAKLSTSELPIQNYYQGDTFKIEYLRNGGVIRTRNRRQLNLIRLPQL